MSLSNVLDGVKIQIGSYAKAYEAARQRLPRLAPHATTAELLASLRPWSRADGKQEKGELVTLLVEQAQADKHPLWNALLLTSFTPMLMRLRKRSQRNDEVDDDQDQAVLLAFLEAVREICPGKHTAMGLRWMTEGKVFGKTREDRLAPEMEALDDAVHGQSHFAFEAQESARAAAMEIVELLKKRGITDGLDVLLCTEALGEPLEDYITRTSPPRAPRTRERSRLMRARARAMKAAADYFERRRSAA